MKPFAVWKLKTGLYWNSRPNKANNYRISMWVIGIDGAKDCYDVMVDYACTIRDLLPILIKEQTELFTGVSEGKVIDAGFECYIVR